MSDVYSINNLKLYAESIRKNAALSFCENYSENLYDYISIGQMIDIMKQNSIGMDDDGNYLIDEDSYDLIFDETRTRLYNVGLTKLAAEGKIECAWDDDKNEMIFWEKDSKTIFNSAEIINESRRKKKRDS